MFIEFTSKVIWSLSFLCWKAFWLLIQFFTQYGSVEIFYFFPSEFSNLLLRNLSTSSKLSVSLQVVIVFSYNPFYCRKVDMLSRFSRVQLCDPMGCSPPGPSVHGIFQARILEWVAISSSRGSSRPRDQTHISCVSWTGRWVLYHWCHL